MTDKKDKLFTAFKHTCENQDTVASQAVKALSTIELTGYLKYTKLGNHAFCE